MNPHADRDRSEQPTERAAAPEAIHIPQGLADHFGISAGPYRLKQPGGRTATPDAGTTREQKGHDVEACPWCRMGYPNWCAEREALRDEVGRAWERVAYYRDSEVPALRSNADGWARRAEAAEAKVEQVRALAESRDVVYPRKFKFGASENYVLGTRHARAEVLAILDGAQTPQTTPDGPETPLSRPGSASGGTETGEALEGAQGGEER